MKQTRAYNIVKHTLTIAVIGFVLSSVTSVALANSVIDIYNISKRQMMKNEQMQKFSDVIKNGSPDIKTLAETYNCEDNPNFDSFCRDWTFDDSGRLLRTQDQLLEIQHILGDNLALGNDSFAVQYLECLEGTKNYGTLRAKATVNACKDIMNWNYNPIMVGSKDVWVSPSSADAGLADMNLLEYYFAPTMNFFIDEDSKGQKVVRSRPVGNADVPKQDLSAIQKFARQRMTMNLCDSDTAVKSEETIKAELRNLLASSYATAVAVKRSGELFDEHAFPHLKNLLTETTRNPNLSLNNIRKSLHLLIAADSQIIWQLGQINAVQGLLTEIKVLNNIGGIKTFGGVTATIGTIKSQKEICDAVK